MNRRWCWLGLMLALFVVACQAAISPTPEPPVNRSTTEPAVDRATPEPAIDRSAPEDEGTPAREERLETPPAALPELVPTEAPQLPVTGEVPAGLLAAMIADLAGRLAIAETEISVQQAKSVTWPDGAMGCPQPDMAYTQAPVSGYRVVLLAARESYAYHASERGSFILCEQLAPGGKPLPGSTPVQ